MRALSKILLLLPLFGSPSCDRDSDKTPAPGIQTATQTGTQTQTGTGTEPGHSPGFPIPNPLPPIPGLPDLPIPDLPGLPIPGAPGGEEPAPTPGNPGEQVSGMLREINAARASRGLSAVAFDGKLDCAAQHHADDIGPKHICGHTGSDGSSPWVRAERCGTSANGEIVACGQGSPRAAVEAWTASPGHAAIMYDPAQRAVGGGWNGNYWVALFRQ